jgi:hypothetical protein
MTRFIASAILVIAGREAAAALRSAQCIVYIWTTNRNDRCDGEAFAVV